MRERVRCAPAAQSRNEPLFATASKVRRWILVEEPGPWGQDAVHDSRLPPGVGLALKARTAALRARVLLIRRHRAPVPATRTCFVACTQPGRNWVERLTVDNAADLLAVDWNPLGRDEPVGGTPVDHPLYLVCTNGRHDPCCAEYGRPLVHVLNRVAGDRVWESSHFGGDRFAGNLVCLPHGLYFGHVAPEQGPQVVAAYERGLIDLRHYRGRSCYAFVVQAAEFFVRTHQALRGVDDLGFVRRRNLGDGRVLVTFTSPAGRWFVADVQVSHPPEGRLLTCRATSPLRPPQYRLLGIEAGPV
ncbi:MAG TPA: sucrase ferredoxin [Egibacteraceae bacterium]|nr:sucrase ferredoxin [Egibacteraceae bacterium]